MQLKEVRSANTYMRLVKELNESVFLIPGLIDENEIALLSLKKENWREVK